MSQVRVTFHMVATDPDDRTGLTEGDYNQLMEDLMMLGAEDIDVDLED